MKSFYAYGFSAVSAALLNCSFLLLALFAPKYQEREIVLPGGAVINVSISLLRTYCISSCSPAWKSIALLSKNSLTQFYERACWHIVKNINDKTLLNAVANMCALSVTMSQFADIGCSTLNNIYNASLPLIFTLVIAVMFCFISSGLLLIFFLKYRSLRIRKFIIGFQFGAAVAVVIGIILYLIRGCGFNADDLPFDHSSRSFMSPTHFPAQIGLGICICAVLWTCVTPFWTIYAIRCCMYENPNDELYEEEVEGLVSSLDEEVKKSIFFDEVSKKKFFFYTA